MDTDPVQPPPQEKLTGVAGSEYPVYYSKMFFPVPDARGDIKPVVAVLPQPPALEKLNMNTDPVPPPLQEKLTGVVGSEYLLTLQVHPNLLFPVPDARGDTKGVVLMVPQPPAQGTARALQRKRSAKYAVRFIGKLLGSLFVGLAIACVAGAVGDGDGSDVE